MRKRICLIIFLFTCLTTHADTYKGSHAYNHTKAFNAQVNTATGTFDFSYPLIHAQGILMPLKVSLTYRFNAKGMFGLPTGWQLDLDYIADKTAELGGKQWLIDNLWHDEAGFASGLKYYNQHGSRFDDAGEAKVVPGYPALSYRFKSQHKDGSEQYFSQQGLLVLQVDRFGNAVQFYYQEPVKTLESARLTRIVDNYGNTYQLDYEPNLMIVRYPDDREQRIYFNGEGVTEIINPLTQSYHITYAEVAGRKLLRTLASPEGLLTELSYDSIPYKDSGSTKQMPVVIRFKQSDLADHKTHHEAHYIYSKGNNYTGYPRYALSDKGDSLIDSNDQAYKYSVEVTRFNGDQLHHQVYEYNYLHLPVEVRTTRLDKPYLKTTYEYAISPFKYSRSTNYDKPKSVTHHVWHQSQSAYIPSDKTDTTYDNYGNKLTETTSVYDLTRRQWTALKATRNQYFTDNYSLLAERIQEDLLSGKAIRQSFKLAPSGKTHSAQIHTWKPYRHVQDWQDWQQTSLTYDEQGRQRSSTLKWLATGQPGVQSVTNRTHYRFDTASALLTTIEVSDSGRTHTTVTDTRNGQKLKTLTPKGEETRLTYDALNRQVTHTDPEGFVVHTAYDTFSTDGQNAITYQSPLGDKRRTIQDASSRAIAHQDYHHGLWRTLSSQTYNSFGKVDSKTDILGLVTTFSYDEQGRRTRTSDPWGNVHRVSYDDEQMTTTTFINEHQYQVVSKVPWQRKQLTQTYPVMTNPQDKPTVFVEDEVVQDAFKKDVKTSSSLVDLNTHAHSETITHTYQYDASQNATTSETVTWDGMHADKTRTYDLQRNLYSWHKTLRTPEHTSSHEGYRYHYDADGLLTAVESPATIGGRHLYLKHRYDKNGKEIERTLQDGHRITYAYDKRGLLTQRSWNRDRKRYAVTHHYDADGRLTQVSDTDGQAMHYHYTLNGHLVEMHYPDNRSLHYTLDDYDRIIVQTDADQREQHYSYHPDDKGRLSSLTVNNSRIDFHYGEDDNGQQGQLLKKTTDAIGTGLTETHFRYSAYGQLSGYVSSNHLTGATYGVSYHYKPRGELVTQVQQLNEKDNPQHVQTTHYHYDGLQRLTDEKQVSLDHNQGNQSWHKAYHYDGNNNLIGEDTHLPCGDTHTQQYFYNSLDQLVNIKQDGAENPIPFIYDRNGRMMQDHTGTAYEYDDAGFLLRVTPKGKAATHYRYLPNGLLGHSVTGRSHSDYYPDGNKDIQTVYKDNQWSSLIRHGSGIIGVQTDTGMDQLFKLNQSTGAILQLDKQGDTAFSLNHYDAYGKPLYPHDPKGQRAIADFGWNQELTEPNTQLTYLRHRFYHPTLRRFITRDSMPVDNRYAYAHANPVNYIDPTGHSPVVNYSLGSGLTALGVLGVFLAAPTGGASLTLSAAAGIGAGVTAALSGISLLGSQAALDAGNKAAAKALSITSITLGTLAIAEGVVAIAPDVARFIANNVSFPRTASFAFGVVFDIKPTRNWMVNEDTQALSGETDVANEQPNMFTLKRDMKVIDSFKVDGVDMKPILLSNPETDFSEAGVSNEFFDRHIVHQGLLASMVEKFVDVNPGKSLSNLPNGAPMSYEISGNTARMDVTWHQINFVTATYGRPFRSVMTAAFDPVKKSYTWYFEYPTNSFD